MKRTREFLEALAVLVLLTGGLPMRGTELTALKHSNDWCTSRNFVIESGHMAVVSEYSKTESVAGRPMVIVRYLPDQLGALVLAYLADIRPFLELAEVGLDLHVGRPRSPLMWESDGTAWNTERITEALGRVTHIALNCRLTVRQWRQIAIAIDRDLLANSSTRTLTEETQNTINHVLQAGHSAETGSHHYALSLDMLVGTTHESITAFRQISQGWHRLFGLDQSDPCSNGVSTKGTPSSAEASSTTGSLEGPAQPSNLTAAKIHTPSQRTSDSGFTEEAAVARPRPTTAVTPSIKKRAHNPDTPTTTCSDLSTELLGPFSSNSMVTPEAGFLPPVERHLSSATSPSQDQRSKVQPSSAATTEQGVLESQAQALLQVIFGANARWTSDDQRIAVVAVLEGRRDVLAVLAPGSGKSLLIMIPALLSRSQVTVAIIPFIALRDDLQARCRSVGVHTLIWSRGTVSTTSLVLVTPELAVSGEFQTYLQKLIREERLARLVFDECHVAAIDGGWRRIMGEMRWIGKLPVQRVLMTGTLAKSHEHRLFESLDLNPNQDFCQIIRGRTISERFQHLIHVEEGRELLRLLRIYMIRSGSRNKITLIFAMTVTETVNLARQLGVPYYHSQMPMDERAAIISRLRQGDLTALVGTTTLSNGIDIANVDTVIHWLGVYSLSDLVQQSRRAGRQGERAYSVLLLDPESQGAILSGESDNSKALKPYVNNSQCMLKVLSEHLDDGMEPLNCDSLWPCTFCGSGTPRLVDSQITHVSETTFGQPSSSSIGSSPARLSQTLTPTDRVHLQAWRERCDQLRLGQQCAWCYLQTGRWGFHPHCLEACAAQPPPPETPPSYVMDLLRLLRRVRPLTGTDGVHFMCFLPKRVFHPGSPDFSKACAYDKLVLQTVLLAAECQLQRPVFERHGVSMVQRSVNDMADILGRAPGSALAVGVNIMVSLFHDLVMGSDT